MLNPEALKNRRNPAATGSILQAFSEIGQTALVDRENGLTDTFRRWSKEGLDLVAISGGDGTVQLVIQEMVDAWDGAALPRLLLFHGGGAGIVSKGVGSPDPQQAATSLRAALDDHTPLKAERFRTLRVDGRVAFSFGIGAFRRICAFYHTYRRPGVVAHLRLAARFTGSLVVGGGLARSTLDPSLTSVRIGEETYSPSHFTGLYASSLERLWVLKAYQQIPCPAGGFRVIGLLSIGRMAMMRGAASFLSGRGDSFFTDCLLCGTQVLEVQPDHAPLEYMTDGEFYATEDILRVESGPSLTAVRL